MEIRSVVRDFNFMELQRDYPSFFKQFRYPDVAKLCALCSRVNERQMFVPPSGNPLSTPVWVGRDPGSQEEIDGIPFHPKTFHGKILNRCLASFGWDRSDVYITNSLFCRGTNSRVPEARELLTCSWWKQTEIDWHNRIIFPMGKDAAWLFLGDLYGYDLSRTLVFYFMSLNSFVIPLHHPGYLMRKPNRELQDQIDYLTDLSPQVCRFYKHLKSGSPEKVLDVK